MEPIESPRGRARVDPRIAECRRLVSRSALIGAGVSLLPVPGLDIAADAALLAQLIHRINLRFGLSEGQVEAMAPARKALVYKAATLVGATLVGQAIRPALVMAVMRAAGLRLTAGQAARLVPLAGNLLTAGVAYLTMRQVLYRHIDDCARVSAQLQLAAPAQD